MTSDSIDDWPSLEFADQPTQWLRSRLADFTDTLSNQQNGALIDPLCRWIDEIESVIASRGSYRERVDMGDVDFL